MLFSNDSIVYKALKEIWIKKDWMMEKQYIMKEEVWSALVKR